MSASLSKTLTCYLIQLYLLRRLIYYKCFKRDFSVNIQAFSADASCEIPESPGQLF